MTVRALPILFVLLSPLAARADAIGPSDPSVVCPYGARDTVNHCGTVCVSQHCESDADCHRDGDVCVTVSLCAEDEPYCGGWTSEPYERIHGACADGCGAGEECRTFRACAPGSAADAGAEMDAGSAGEPDAGGAEVVTYGCGCRATRPRGGLAAVALSALVGLWLARRRM